LELNSNDELTNLIFKEIKARLTVKEYFINFIFDSSTAAAAIFKINIYNHSFCSQLCIK